METTFGYVVVLIPKLECGVGVTVEYDHGENVLMWVIKLGYANLIFAVVKDGSPDDSEEPPVEISERDMKYLISADPHYSFHSAEAGPSIEIPGIADRSDETPFRVTFVPQS